ncbi:hypothetical protein BU16DRAFT_54598 [Lophium mytilinum]|uniref:Uncharacterized protein n=1 Tax=Lophium mytilinum TaxID=390894 RepID=A0A6A6QNT0_9PEZI|nr:hypothetical protein BU16DRAFT_54598 [Lophium mytilinum]
MFATTLAHEISHAYWMFFRGAESDFHEPLHQQGDQKCELGFSWEQWAFGHQINPLSFLTGRRVHEGPLTTSLVLQFRDGEETTSRKSKFAEFPGVTFEPVSSTKGGAHWITNLTYPTNTRTIWRAVPMEWIAEWFSKSVWDQRSKLELDCRLTAFVGVKDENFSRARLANEAILHDLGRQMFSEDDEHAELSRASSPSIKPSLQYLASASPTNSDRSLSHFLRQLSPTCELL